MLFTTRKLTRRNRTPSNNLTLNLSLSLFYSYVIHQAMSCNESHPLPTTDAAVCHPPMDAGGWSQDHSEALQHYKLAMNEYTTKEETIRHLVRAVELDGVFAKAWLELAVALSRGASSTQIIIKGEATAGNAVDCAVKALTLNQRLTDGWWLLGELGVVGRKTCENDKTFVQFHGRWWSPIALYAEAIALDPSHHMRWHTLACQMPDDITCVSIQSKTYTKYDCHWESWLRVPLGSPSGSVHRAKRNYLISSRLAGMEQCGIVRGGLNYGDPFIRIPRHFALYNSGDASLVAHFLPPRIQNALFP